MFEQPRGDAPDSGFRRFVQAPAIFTKYVMDAPDGGLAGQNFSADVGENLP